MWAKRAGSRRGRGNAQERPLDETKSVMKTMLALNLERHLRVSQLKRESAHSQQRTLYVQRTRSVRIWCKKNGCERWDRTKKILSWGVSGTDLQLRRFTWWQEVDGPQCEGWASKTKSKHRLAEVLLKSWPTPCYTSLSPLPALSHWYLNELRSLSIN